MSHCVSCNMTIEGGNLSAHYSSDLHLVNVRRKVEGLRPLTAQEHRMKGGASAEEPAEGGTEGPPVYSCTLCKKHFRSVQTLQTHIRSTAHLMRKEERIVQRDSEAASMLTSTSLGSAAIGLHRRHNAKAKAMKAAKEPTAKGPKVAPEDRDEDTSPTRCFFCGHPSEDVDSNLAHMEKTHEFFVPMKTHCSNVEGLLLYLSRKVNGLMCLVCNEKTRSFQSLDALRDHMRESNHERIVLSVEYNEFYDCALEDPDNMQKVEVDGDQLVVGANGDKTGKVILRKEADVPRARPRESEQHAQQRKAILASENAALEAARKEHRELTTVERRQQGEITRRSDAEYQALQLKVSMRANKLHPKGYDGEGTLY